VNRWVMAFVKSVALVASIFGVSLALTALVMWNAAIGFAVVIAAMVIVCATTIFAPKDGG
jgi:hypothetical protein